MRTYIFTYAETYDSLSLERLAEMFGLSLQSVHSIVSKMIFKEEFLVRAAVVVVTETSDKEHPERGQTSQ